MKFGIIGLGKMGGNLALQAQEKGLDVVGMNKTPKPELEASGIDVLYSIEEMVKKLTSPRIVLIYVPAGQVVDDVIGELLQYLESSDVIIDGGNSHFGDSIRRHRECGSKGVHFVDCGTSGGLEGARNGACFMVGGEQEAALLVKPILESLAVKGGYLHAGPPGAGHFVKLVHNAVEFVMLQAIGEGTALLERSDFQLNLAEIFENWSHGSVVRGWLVELMAQQLKKQPINEIPFYVEDTGEVNWIVEAALEMEVPIPAISVSIMELFASRDENRYASRSISLIRNAFGGHPFGPDEAIRQERQKGKVMPQRRAA